LEKTYDATVKATGRKGTALVSVFHNVDLQGDRVLPGAFRRTISEWKSKMARGIRPPFVWSHQWSDPDAYLGPITGLRETAKGLEVDFEITSPSETVKQQHGGEPHHLLRCDADVDGSIHAFRKRQTSLIGATSLEPECRSISYPLEDVADRNHVGRGDFAEDGQAVGEIARVFGRLEHRHQEP